MNNYTNEDKFVELLGKIPNVAVQGYNKDREVIYWNKASEDIYGYSKNEAIGKQLEDLIIPDFMKDDVIYHVKNWYEHKIPIPSGELPLINKDGSTVYVYSSHVMLNQDSDNPEMFCIDINLTQQKNQEKLLKEKDKELHEQAKMAAMGQMLDNIAHQWKQPLSIISSTVGGIKIQDELKILDKNTLIESLDAIGENTQYLANTIDDFKGFFKGTHQKVKYNLLDTINYSLRLLDGVVRKNDLNVFIDDSKDIQIEGYPNELVQVIINLISNSKDAFKEHEIEKRYIFINIEEKEDKVFIKIKDNAYGIDEEIIDKIFEQRFTTRKEDGSGIGLAMSLKLIRESVKGDILVKNVEYLQYNRLEKGAEFTIVLPKLI